MTVLLRAPLILVLLLSAAPLRADEAAAILFADYWSEQMRLAPLVATFYGERGHDDRLDDNSLAGRAARKASDEALLKRARVEPQDLIRRRAPVRVGHEGDA